MSQLFTPEYWLERAAALRIEAASMKTSAARIELLKIAAGYERLAEHATAQRGLSHPEIVIKPLLCEPER